MSQSKYITAPIKSTKMPGGIPYIIANEAAERFSFYGMQPANAKIHQLKSTR